MIRPLSVSSCWPEPPRVHRRLWGALSSTVSTRLEFMLPLLPVKGTRHGCRCLVRARHTAAAAAGRAVCGVPKPGERGASAQRGVRAPVVAVWARTLPLTLRQTHRARAKGFVDFSGDGLAIVDPVTGTRTTAVLFVLVLGASHLTYIEPVPCQDLATGIACHVHAFEYFGGVPAALVRDNTKTGLRRPDYYDPSSTRRMPTLQKPRFESYRIVPNHFGAKQLAEAGPDALRWTRVPHEPLCAARALRREPPKRLCDGLVGDAEDSGNP